METTVVEREETPVMGIRTSDDVAAIREAWQRLEEIVPLRGRKFIGAFDPQASSYLACTQLQDDDEPGVLGLEPGTLPGGRYLKTRLQGEPPGVYDEIEPTFRALLEIAETDASRPSIEFYRRRDEIDLFLPIR